MDDSKKFLGESKSILNDSKKVLDKSKIVLNDSNKFLEGESGQASQISVFVTLTPFPFGPVVNHVSLLIKLEMADVHQHIFYHRSASLDS